jgi:hypothetical protein
MIEVFVQKYYRRIFILKIFFKKQLIDMIRSIRTNLDGIKCIYVGKNDEKFNENHFFNASELFLCEISSVESSY